MLFTQFNMDDALEVRGEEKYSEGVEYGRAQGLEQGIKALIEACSEFGISKNDIRTKIQQNFSMPQETMEVYLEKYWKET